ncbi:SET domain protein [Ceratobasidium sp. AG-Ba]|nr:SET domain protein [Ceratobasidium sp. AG-Ba]QRV99519.1 SET domain protein [Ceratobasidium sp. AG-Ba]QRW14027.1 SET domain protein [Ceratobasidium sp. AG-Ba]
MGVVPTDDELIATVRSVRSQNPALGIQKLLAAVLTAEPTWSVSDKRLKKVLQKLKGDEFPTSSLNAALDVGKYSDKVRPVVFGPEKGKGLVAAQDIRAGEVLWREDPFVYAPPWEIYDAQLIGTACAYCARAFTPSTPPLRVQCPHSTSSSSKAACQATFCSRLCLSRSGSTHTLLCPVANPSCDHLLAFLKERKWKAALAFTKCVVRILDAHQGSKGGKDEEGYMDKDAILTTYNSFATLRSDKRWTHTSENDLARSANEKLFAAIQTGLVQAFYIPPPDDSSLSPSLESKLKEIPLVPRSPVREKSLKKILKTPIPPEISASLFSKDGVLEGLGKMSLNLESHGGLFPLHSHLNHSCTPNLSVRHIPGDIHGPNPSRITLIATSEIKMGEEVVISYVDPNQNVKERRRKLREWDFGICRCERCTREEKEVVEETGGKGDMEDEIRGFLGV